MEELGFIPFNMGDCSYICKKIISNDETNKYITGNCFDDFAVSWEGMFLQQAYHLFKSTEWDNYDERMNSIFYSYLESQTMQLEWIIFSLYHGQYDLVLRELRNIVESAFLFYRIDISSENCKKSGEDKFAFIESMKERSKFGRSVFAESGYSDWEKVYLEIYKPLCGYTHTVSSLIRNKETYPEYNGMLAPQYDEKQILRCLYFLQRVTVLETDMMKTIIEEIYNVEVGTYFSKIFDNILVPEP